MEKFADNYEKAAQNVKVCLVHSVQARLTPVCRESAAVRQLLDGRSSHFLRLQEQMDRKFGAPWNVVIGEYFSFMITYEVREGWSLAFQRLIESCRARPRWGACGCWNRVFPKTREVSPGPVLVSAFAQIKNLLYLFLGGTKGILLWKSQ